MRSRKVAHVKSALAAIVVVAFAVTGFVPVSAAIADPGDEHTISGTILAEGSAVPGASIRLYTPDGDLVTTAYADGNGGYELGDIVEGTYYAGFFAGVAYFPHYTGGVDTVHPDNRSIETFDLSGDLDIDANLAPMWGGNVINLSAEFDSDFFDPFITQADLERLEGDTWYSLGDFLMWKDDDYETVVKDLPPAQYRLVFHEDGYTDDVKPVTFAAGVANVHGALVEDDDQSQVTVNVTLDGEPESSGIDVWKWESDTSTWQPYYDGFGSSEDDGQYTLDARPGYYSIHFTSVQGGGLGAPQYLGGTNTAPAGISNAAEVIHVLHSNIVRNVELAPLDGSSGTASLTGTVITGAAVPISGARVDVVRGYRHYEAVTDAGGAFTISGIAAHAADPYTVRVTPAGDTLIGATRTVLLPPSAPVHDLGTVTLHEPWGLSTVPDVSISPVRATTANTVPVVFFGDTVPVTLSNQCAGGTAHISAALGDATLEADLVEQPSDAGVYAGVIPAAYPGYGVADLEYSVSCPIPSEDSQGEFNVYVEPSSMAIDRYNQPVAGATITILRSATETGSYSALPSNSALLSPANRLNPRMSGADGRFDFNVAPGWYKIKTALGGSSSTTDPMQVPPGRSELLVFVNRPGAVLPASVVPLGITGTDAVGQRLRVTGGVWSPEVRLNDFGSWYLGSSGRGNSWSHLVASGEPGKLVVKVQGGVWRESNFDGLEGRRQLSEAFFELTIGTQKFTKTPTPTISGSPKVGGTLTAKPGTWSPSGATFSYLWFLDGVVQPGETAATFTPGVAAFGKKVTVQAVAHKAGWADKVSATSKATAAVGKGDLVAPKPTISGTVKVGEVLTVTTGDWGPVDAAPQLAVQWLREGKAISGADGLTYELKGADYGKKMSVKVTGTATGANAGKFAAKSSTSASTGKVAVATMTTTGTPSISGEAEVGSTLTAGTGVWVPTPDSYKYQWYSATATGSPKPIDKATKATYVVPSTALGKLISVKVTNVNLGYVSTGQTTAPTTPIVKGDFDSPTTPTITGNPQAGATLTAVPGAWETTGVTFHYQWFADGDEIVGATKSTLKLADTDFGSSITVAVRASKAGYVDSPFSDQSAPSGPVLHSFATAVPKITGTVAVGSTLTVAPPVWTPAAAFTYEWFRTKGSLVESVGTAEQYAIQVGDKGFTIKVVATGTATDYATASISSVATKKVP